MPTAKKAKKTCFCIVPIGDEGTPVRERADELMEFVVEDVLASRYDITRADLLPRPGVITTQIMQELVESDLVIADLTDGNPNVFYELAIRHVARKPFVQLIATGQRLPFDIAPMRTIFFNIHSLTSVKKAKIDLAEQVEYLENDPDIETPISRTLELSLVPDSDKPFADTLIETVNDLAYQVAELRTAQQRAIAFPTTQWNISPSQVGPLWQQGSGVRLVQPQQVGASAIIQSSHSARALS